MRLFPAQPPPNRLQISVRSCEIYTNTGLLEARQSPTNQRTLANRDRRFGIEIPEMGLRNTLCRGTPKSPRMKNSEFGSQHSQAWVVGSIPTAPTNHPSD